MKTLIQKLCENMIESMEELDCPFADRCQNYEPCCKYLYERCDEFNAYQKEIEGCKNA